jgi:hypothetical protein
MKKAFIFYIGLALSVGFWSCTKENINRYNLSNVAVVKPTGAKGTLKTDLEFISVAYADLFGTQISTDQLNKLIAGYTSVGDKSLIIDRIIRNFLNDPTVQIPTQQQMMADKKEFIKDCFKKFYVRDPDEMEIYYLEKLINETPGITPKLVYYTFMITDEYRYY